jgi:ribose transport system ATP-binding protein
MNDHRILELTNVTKRFPGVVALDNISISFERGAIHCIIGENGAGKSTLAKILAGLYAPDEGRVIIQEKDAYKDKKVFERVAYVPQELNLFKYMTVAENLFIPFSKSGFRNAIFTYKELFKLAVPYLKKFQINSNPSDLVADISVSDQQLLQIARAIANEFYEIIILDEPTSSLSLKEIELFFSIMDQLKKENKVIIFISHKIEEIFSVGHEVTVLRNGVKVFNLKVEDTTMQEVISQMTGHDIDLSMTFYPEDISDEVILEAEDLTGKVFSNISFRLHKGEILGFAGLVGAGRTEIMQTIFGYLPAWGGKVKFQGKPLKLGDIRHSVNSGILYIPEDRKSQGIFPLLSVRENITMPLLNQVVNGLIISNNKERELAGEVIKAYEIKTSSLDREIQYLSGGNQQKVIIGRSVFCKPKVLILDEPTKGIDVGTKTEIYKILKRLAHEGIGIIVVSSELEELMKCSNRIITIYKGKRVGEFETSKSKKSDIINLMLGINKSVM